jgi:hypothetical protein
VVRADLVGVDVSSAFEFSFTNDFVLDDFGLDFFISIDIHGRAKSVPLQNFLRLNLLTF